MQQHNPDHMPTLLKPHPGKLPIHPNAPNVERIYAPASHMLPNTNNRAAGYAHIWEFGGNGQVDSSSDNHHVDERQLRELPEPMAYYSEQEPLRAGLPREHVYEDIPISANHPGDGSDLCNFDLNRQPVSSFRKGFTPC